MTAMTYSTIAGHFEYAFAAFVALSTLMGGLLYRKAWYRYKGQDFTPTGFGVFLATSLLASSMVYRAEPRVIAVFAVIQLAAAVFWLDDLRELSARLRIFVSLFSGVAIGLLVSTQAVASFWSLVTVVIATAIINVVLTNIVNFYDGADLNLATFIAITSGAVLLTQPSDRFLSDSAITCLAFIAPFAVMNSRPKTIYLGDAGSFVFAGLLTMLAATYFTSNGVSAMIAIPALLPALDTSYVLFIRIKEKHDLLSRNYLHLYQKLQHRYRGFGYLAPQVVNAGITYGAAAILHSGGFGEFYAVVLAAVIVTVPFYIACWQLFLAETDTH